MNIPLSKVSEEMLLALSKQARKKPVDLIDEFIKNTYTKVIKK